VQLLRLDSRTRLSVEAVHDSGEIVLACNQAYSVAGSEMVVLASKTSVLDR